MDKKSLGGRGTIRILSAARNGTSNWLTCKGIDCLLPARTDREWAMGFWDLGAQWCHQRPRFFGSLPFGFISSKADFLLVSHTRVFSWGWETVLGSFFLSQEQLFKKPATDLSLSLIGPNWITWHFWASSWEGGWILSEWWGLPRSWGGVTSPEAHRSCWWARPRRLSGPGSLRHSCLLLHKTSSMLVSCKNTIDVSCIFA